MRKPLQLEERHRRLALDRWLDECRRRMAARFPRIDFTADKWPIKTLYQTVQIDWHFPAQVVDFAEKDRSFAEVLRCLVAEMVIDGSPKDMLKQTFAFRRLAETACHSIFDLTVTELRTLEANCLAECRANPQAAPRTRNQLTQLAKQLIFLANKNVVSRLGYNVRADVKAELRALTMSQSPTTSAERGVLLDRKIEALNDALNALIDDDPRLDAADRVAICAMTRKLCAPSRINEVLCSSINDSVTVDDYARRPQAVDTKDVTYSAHQMLLVTMKGSKGAQWGAKPVLNFMIDAFHFTEGVIKEHGSRSRSLVEWYEAHPDELYLPEWLGSLRGRALNRRDVARIMYMRRTRREGTEEAVGQLFAALKDVCFKGPNPETHTASGTVNPRKIIDFVPWAPAEKFLLERVNRAMAACRRVTQLNHYEGDLSKMLFLFDRDDLPYLPYALDCELIRDRLKRSESRKKISVPPTVFEKLGITMPVNGRIQPAELDTHDPRRWLTTMALKHGEQLSDVLINKWANRSSLAQLKAYDFRTDEELATFSRMPTIDELQDLSGGLKQARKLEDVYGMKTDIVAVHNAGISVTSIERIRQAIEDRPIAKTSEQIIIVYPSRYGACLHQHHETPCRRYASCLTCNENVCVKGHLATNEEIRKDASTLATNIVRQLEVLIPALNRGIADHPDAFAEHLAALVDRGLCPDKMAIHLIDDFNEIKEQIKDKLLRRRLEEAFVAHSFVRLLDNHSIANGALMKYFNPKQHAAPGLEIALDSHGGREQIAAAEHALVNAFPAFAPTAHGLRDERSLTEAEDDDEGD
jgi:hypothetical protein